MKKEDILQKVADKLQEVNSYYSGQYTYSKEMLYFASGEQWNADVLAQRDKDARPSIVVNELRPYINRHVNPVRMNPFGMEVSLGDENINELVNDVLREISNKSRAKEVFEIALENAVTCGIGWIKVGTDYVSDDDFEQKICIEPVNNPLSVWIDPTHQRPDGSDAKYGMCIDYVDKDTLGDDIAYGDGYNGMDAWKMWPVPKNSVPVMVYYELVEESVDKYAYIDGTISTEFIEGLQIINKRKVKNKYCKVYKIVGNVIEEESRLDVPYIPLIPVYGDKIHHPEFKWVGLTHWVMDSQRMLNLYASNELELAALAPKAPFAAVDESIEGYDEWDTANTRNHSVLRFRAVSHNGQMLPAPQRLSNVADNGQLVMNRQNASATISKQLGMFDNALGMQASGNTSGYSLNIVSEQSDITNAHYIQNLALSIEQCTRVVCWLLPYVYDTERQVVLRNVEGQTQKVTINLSQIIDKNTLKEMDVTVNAGPMFASKRKQAVATVFSIAQSMPDKLPLLADLLVSNLDAPGTKEIAERLRKLLPPELKDNIDAQITPEVKAILDEAQNTVATQEQTIEYLEGAVRQLQNRLLSEENKLKATMAKTIIDNESKMALEKMQQIGENYRTQLKIEADMDKTVLSNQQKMEGEMRKVEQQFVTDIAKNLVDVGTPSEIPVVEVGAVDYTTNLPGGVL